MRQREFLHIKYKFLKWSEYKINYCRKNGIIEKVILEKKIIEKRIIKRKNIKSGEKADRQSLYKCLNINI